jgi:hypothetical protein
MTKKNNETIENTIPVILKKRGRKSKKEILEQSKENKDNIIVLIEEQLENTIINSIDEILKCDEDCSIENEIENSIFFKLNNDINNDINNDTKNDTNDEVKPGAKKRGRKPKGGKIIQHIVPLTNNKESKPNVILHLKCSLKDLQNNTVLSSNIEGYNFSTINNDYSYEVIGNNFNNIKNVVQNNYNIQEKPTTYNKPVECVEHETVYDYEDDIKQNKENDIREVWKKLKVLEYNLHINNISDKKSACFWCTYEFDNPPIYIPKHHIKETYQVYGCFCSPECATAYLMEENIDSSSKFERYHLINHIYSKIYDYKKNIKPAPNPYYMLEKYYGNLNIQEYRALLKNDRLFLVVDKPLTRILPELHEDNDDFIINNKIIPSNTYQIKKNLQKKHQTKSNILNEKFGLIQQ